MTSHESDESNLPLERNRSAISEVTSDVKEIRKQLERFRRAVADINVPIKFDGKRENFVNFSSQFRNALASISGYNLISFLTSCALVKPTEYPELSNGESLLNFNIRGCHAITNLLLKNVDPDTNKMLASEAVSHPWSVKSISSTMNGDVDTTEAELTTIITKLKLNGSNLLDPLCHPSVLWTCLNKCFGASSDSELESFVVQFHSLKMKGKTAKAFECFVQSINHYASIINGSNRLLHQHNGQEHTVCDIVMDQEKRRVLLHGIPDAVDRTHIQYDCPTYGKAVDQLRSLYRERDTIESESVGNGIDSTVENSESKSVSAVTHENSSGSGSDRGRGFQGNCYNCGKYGHTADECRSNGSSMNDTRGGFRGGFRGRTRGHGRGRGRGGYNNTNNSSACDYCGKRYHSADQCFLKQRDESAGAVARLRKWNESHRVNAVTQPDDDDKKAQSTDSSDSKTNKEVILNDQHGRKSTGAVTCVNDSSSDDEHECIHTAGVVNNESPCSQPQCAILDTGSGYHLCNNKSWFKNRIYLKRHVKFNGINGNRADPVVAMYKGTIALPCLVNGTLKAFEISEVYYVPTSNDNLISLGRLVRDKTHVWNLKYISTNNGSQLNVMMDNNCTMVASDIDSQYVIELAPIHTAQSSTVMHAVTNKSDWFDWHARLGHPGPDVQQQLLSRMNIKCERPAKLPVCEVCEAGKSRSQWSQRFKPRATEQMQRLHIDLSGRVRHKAHDGAQYVGMVVDDFSRMHMPLFLNHKSDLASQLKEQIMMCENQMKHRVQFIRCDNGGENIVLKQYCADRGIEMELTVPRHSVQNGVAERAIGDVFQRARCLMYASGAPASLWEYAIAHAADLHNNLPSKANSKIAPCELWNDRQPVLDELKPFGCLAHVHISIKHSKLEPRCKQLIHLGRDRQRVAKSWLFWDLATKSVITQSDVTFDETRFPWKEKKNSKDSNLDAYLQIAYDNESCTSVDPPEHSSDQSLEHQQQVVSSDSDDDDDSGSDLDDDQDREPSDIDSRNQRLHVPGRSQQSAVPNGPISQRYNLRENRNVPPIRYQDVQAGLYSHAVNAKSCVTVHDPDRPESRDEAMQSKHQSDWTEAEQNELNTFTGLDVFDIVKLPPGRTAVRTRWVYDTKRDDKNIILRRKARLVACGYSQKPGIDFELTRAEVAERRTFRLMLAVANQMDMDISQIDVTAAFLNSKLDEEIYVQQPPGYDDNSGRVWRLKKALYGLKQAAYAWERELSSTLIKIGFTVSENDPCLFIMRDGQMKALLAAHVDDMMLATNDSRIKKRVIDALESRYKIKVDYQPHWFLKMRITRDRTAGTLKLDNEQYVSDFLKQYNMDEVRPVSSPTPNGQYLTKELNETVVTSSSGRNHHSDQEQSIDESMYRAAVGSLNYLTSQTRPDIAFAVNQVSRYCNGPQPHHWEAVKHIMRYISSTRSNGLTFVRKVALPIHGYSDASHAGDLSDRKSINGWVFRVGGAPISWSSKKQSTVALSSTEAEIISASEACREAYSIQRLLLEIDEDYSSIRPPITLFMDSRSAVAIAINGGYRSKLKHVDVRSLFVGQAVQDRIVKCTWVPTENMIADVLTKPITGNLFKRLSQQLVTA